MWLVVALFPPLVAIRTGHVLTLVHPHTGRTGFEGFEEKQQGRLLEEDLVLRGFEQLGCEKGEGV